MAEPFTIDIPDETLDDLRDRLGRTRWPGQVEAGWDRGTDLAYLQELVAYWHDGYDWRATERRLNELVHVTAEVDGMRLHAVRAGTPGGTPLLLLHGWPDSFLRFEPLLPLLGEFDLVVPSLPGWGFSDRPAAPGVHSARIADLMAGLMTDLGLGRFAVHGGDIGSGVAEQLAHRHPERLIGLHLLEVPFWHLFAGNRADLSDAELDYLRRGEAWAQAEGAYSLEQRTKPQTLAYGLLDSPAGLAAWYVEKYRSWSDCDGDVGRRFSADQLLDNLTLHWVTGTAGSAVGVYYENARSDQQPPPVRPPVPAAVAVFPKDLVPTPREYAERWLDLRRWTEMPRGGHFAAMEEPRLLADDLRAFLAPLAGSGA